MSSRSTFATSVRSEGEMVEARPREPYLQGAAVQPLLPAPNVIAAVLVFTGSNGYKLKPLCVSRPTVNTLHGLFTP